MGLLDFFQKDKKPTKVPALSQASTSGEFSIINASQIADLGNIMVKGTSTSVNSPAVALKFSEYYNCVNKVSNTLATMTTNFYENDIKLKEGDYNQVFLWKKMMYPGVSTPKQLKAWTINYLKGGNGFMIVKRDKNYNPMCYVHREYFQMKPFKVEGDIFYYDHVDQEIYHWYNVLHLADIINDELQGVSKVKHYSEQLGRSRVASEFVNKYFNAGLFLSGYIGYPVGSGIDDKDIPDLQKMMQDSYGGIDKAGQMAIITEGGEIKQFKTDIPLSDTEWLASEKVTKDDVRAAFSVPEKMDTEGSRTEYYENAVLPVVKQIESEVNVKIVSLFDQNDIRFKFEVESILRADVNTKANVIEKYLRNSIYTINEARGLVNLPPIEGGDVPMVMANNMVPLEQLQDFIDSKMK